MHGVVYGIKCLLRSESPRDYIDMERSLKHRPNVTICDIAHLVAKHGNRTVPNMFCPDEGRLCPPTEENLLLAEDGKVLFSAPFLENVAISTDITSNNNFNPITNSAIHLALFDWFHEGNCKNRLENLRKSSLVKQISGLVDTQAVEQLFNSSKRDIYFLNNMLPLHHLFVFRLLYHLRNIKLNSKLESRMKIEFPKGLDFNRYGQLKEMYLDINNTDFSQQVQNNNSVVVESLNYVPLDSPNYSQEEIQVSIERSQWSEHFRELNGLEADDRSHIASIRHLREAIYATIESGSSLSDQEKAALLYNVRYANRVLFKHPSRERQLEIRTILSDYGLFQTQGTSNYCGLCCINNIIGPTENGNFPVSAWDMDQIADIMWLEMLDNPAFGLLVPAEPLRDQEGFYSFEVIQETLAVKNITLIRINNDSLTSLSPSALTELLLCQANTDVCDVIIRLRSSEHWISVRVWRERSLLFDSRDLTPTVLSQDDIYHFITDNSAHPGAVYVMMYAHAEQQQVPVHQSTKYLKDSMEFGSPTRTNKQVIYSFYAYFNVCLFV